MEKYHEENGMQRILRELSSLLEDTSIGTVSDRALLLDYKATLERNIGKAVKLEKEAMSLLSPVTPEKRPPRRKSIWKSGWTISPAGKYRTGKTGYGAGNQLIRTIPASLYE